MYIFMNHSKLGYEVAVIGESEKTALYAGINIKKSMLIALALSGGLCGLTGMIQASAVSNTLSIEVSGGVGNTAIITTWLSGLSAPLIAAASFLFAALLQGGAYIQTAFSIPAAIADMLQGIILFFILGSEFFIQYMPITQKSLEQHIQQEIDEKNKVLRSRSLKEAELAVERKGA